MGGRRSRPAFGIVSAMLAAAGVAHFVIAALGSGNPQMRPTSVLTSISLTDDDGGSALFPSTALAPNLPVSRCVRIGYAGAGPAEQPGVRLAARNLHGGLVSYLTVAVEVGSGGGFAGCEGFQGQQVYNGGLAGLGTARGVDTRWTPSPGDARTYRITVALSPLAGAGSGRATATLEWSVGSLFGPEPPTAAPATPIPASPSRTPWPAVAGTPAVPPSGVSIPTCPAPGTAESSEAPADQGCPGVVVTGEPSGSAPAQTSSSGWRSVLGPLAGRIIEAMVAVANRSGRDSGQLVAAVVLLLLFLLVQRRNDRRDPKLAIAPRADDRYAYVPQAGEHVVARAALRRSTPQSRNGFPEQVNGVSGPGDGAPTSTNGGGHEPA